VEKISCVLFDLGGVIVYWHNKWLIKEVCIRFELNLKETTKVFQETIPSLSSGKIRFGKKSEKRLIRNLWLIWMNHYMIVFLENTLG